MRRYLTPNNFSFFWREVGGNLGYLIGLYPQHKFPAANYRVIGRKENLSNG